MNTFFFVGKKYVVSVFVMLFFLGRESALGGEDGYFRCDDGKVCPDSYVCERRVFLPIFQKFYEYFCMAESLCFNRYSTNGIGLLEYCQYACAYNKNEKCEGSILSGYCMNKMSFKRSSNMTHAFCHDALLYEGEVDENDFCKVENPCYQPSDAIYYSYRDMLEVASDGRCLSGSFVIETADHEQHIWNFTTAPLERINATSRFIYLGNQIDLLENRLNKFNIGELSDRFFSDYVSKYDFQFRYSFFDKTFGGYSFSIPESNFNIFSGRKGKLELSKLYLAPSVERPPREGCKNGCHDVLFGDEYRAVVFEKLVIDYNDTEYSFVFVGISDSYSQFSTELDQGVSERFIIPASSKTLETIKEKFLENGVTVNSAFMQLGTLNSENCL